MIKKKQSQAEKASHNTQLPQEHQEDSQPEHPHTLTQQLQQTATNTPDDTTDGTAQQVQKDVHTKNTLRETKRVPPWNGQWQKHQRGFKPV